VPPPPIEPPDGFLEDAAHYPGGHAAGVVFPRHAGEVREVLEASTTVLPIGAQSSLTGGATPMGETILATSRMARVVAIGPSSATVDAGVTIAALQSALAAEGAWFPPAPTFDGACAGGVVATNAAGAATFKYGSTRDWVDALTVVLADGTVLDLQRGQHHARDGQLVIDTRRGTTSVPIPTYRMPDVHKRSAGYFATPDMDAIDLFIGSEGTLGVITRVTFRIVRPAPATALAHIPCASEIQALELVARLREASRETWRTGDPHGIDAAAIEHMDARALAILREDGADVRHQVMVPEGTALALLAQFELPATTTAERAYDDIASSMTDPARDSALGRFCRLLDDAGLLDVTELALPGDRRRAGQLVGLREAIPLGVNQRVGAARRDIDPRIAKTAADMVVPFERFGEMMEVYRHGFGRRGLDFAVWGHISDGNVHPNVLPHSYDDVLRGREAIVEFGREVTRLGGCPLAEHGVGRNPVKQALLRQLYGDEGIDQMRAVKRALDPGWKLAPGVIFTANALPPSAFPLPPFTDSP
jgi:D-lactate dehydrogenase (cytochrome)